MGELGHSEQTPAQHSPPSSSNAPGGRWERGRALPRGELSPADPKSTCFPLPTGAVGKKVPGGVRPSPLSWPARGSQAPDGNNALGRRDAARAGGGALRSPARPCREGARRRRAAGRSRPERAVPGEPSQLSAILSCPAENGDRERVKNKI